MSTPNKAKCLVDVMRHFMDKEVSSSVEKNREYLAANEAFVREAIDRSYLKTTHNETRLVVTDHWKRSMTGRYFYPPYTETL